MVKGPKWGIRSKGGSFSWTAKRQAQNQPSYNKFVLDYQNNRNWDPENVGFITPPDTIKLNNKFNLQTCVHKRKKVNFEVYWTYMK